MKLLSEDNMWKLVAMGATVGASILIRKGMEEAWRVINKEDPPENPASPDTQWREALIWTAAMGLTVGIARLLAERAAAEGWRKYKGHLPKDLYTRKDVKR